MLSKDEIKEIRSRHLSGSDNAPRVLSVLGDENRWHIFTLLIEMEDLCVTDLANILGVSVPAVSQQLRVMEMGGLIKKERVGQMICYRVRKDTVMSKAIVRFVRAFRALTT